MVSQAQQRLRALGLRQTRPRLLLLERLMAESRPQSHLELSTWAEREGIDRVTVYRVLDCFIEAELLHQVCGSDGVLRFCYHGISEGGCPGGHPHLMCEFCGQMWCMTELSFARMEVPEGFEVRAKQMLILGRCSSCSGKA